MKPPAAIRKAVFPAAGLGTRFLPATKAQPKEMLPLVDKPIIQYVVEEAVASGIDNIIIVTGRGKSAIEDHFDVAYELEQLLERRAKHDLLRLVRSISDMINVSYVRQKEPLGLGHALLMARNLVGDEPFAVFLGDDVIEAPVPVMRQMMDLYGRYQCSMVAVERVSRARTRDYGIVAAEPAGDRVYKVTDLVEKPPPAEAPSDLAIIGRYILTPEIFADLEGTAAGRGGEIQLTDGLRALLRRQPIYAYRFSGKRYDTGDKLGFLKATVEFALRRPDLGAPFRSYLKGLDLDDAGLRPADGASDAGAPPPGTRRAAARRRPGTRKTPRART
ncbi:MAG TPA: UTP--glucose-1-phosphate uridylyltransferase GalU [Candidatus Polarisedimenticolia bacterium]|nr:UTP--glucose-1-phosphate uridylyltransferase GalU [Candidatus Polarisedimenticolia bacterium]